MSILKFCPIISYHQHFEGVLLVLLLILVAFLTRRSFQRRKNLSYPTLSDYQSSYVESYDYAHPVFQPSSKSNPETQSGSTENTQMTNSSQANPNVEITNPRSQQLVHPELQASQNPIHQSQINIVKTRKNHKEEFSYIDTRMLERSNRASKVIVM